MTDPRNMSAFLSEPVIGDPYGLYPEPRDEDILNEPDFPAFPYGANANDSGSSSDEGDEREGSAKPRKKVSWRQEEKDVILQDTDGFVPQPFQYNGRIMLVSLPGFLLTLAVAGDM